MHEKCAALVLAAGKGTRMYSVRPKVMQTLLGEPMLWYVYEALSGLLGNSVYTVVGYRADDLAKAFPDRADRFVHQTEQLGTGHALQVAWPRLKSDGYEEILVINGDTPLLDPEQLSSFLSSARSGAAAVTFMTLEPEDIGSFGRVVRYPDNRGCAIVEAKDFDTAVHGPATREINAGIYYFQMSAIEPLLSSLKDDNKSREFYITDLVGLAVKAGVGASPILCGDNQNFLGINNPKELAQAETVLAERRVDALLAAGTILHGPAMVRIGPRAVVEPGAELFGPCELYGAARIARGARVESHCWIKDSSVAQDAVVKPFSHLEGAEVGPACQVGPYARLRPGTVLGPEAKIGNFVETKKAILGQGAKASHLTYLGDAEIGPGVNIGAGTITCNYDGVRKHKTVIGEGAFIGSNTALVAPVEVGREALVGAGSVIRKDVPEGMVAVSRCPQKHYPRKG